MWGQVNGGNQKFSNLKTFWQDLHFATCWGLLQLAAQFEKFWQQGNACANSVVSRGSYVIVHRKMGLNPYKCDVSAIILHISQERGRNQTGAGSHCETRPERHKVLYKKICFASVIFDIVIFIFSTKLWKQKVVSIGSHLCIACIQHYLVKFDYHENSRFFYQKKKFQLPQYVPYSLPGFCQPHNEYH